MESISEILDKVNLKGVKNNLRLYRCYKNIVDQKILKITHDIYCKNKIIFIEVTDKAWANQLLSLRKILIDKFSPEFGKIKDIRIKFVFENKKHNKVYNCEQCGSSLINPGHNLCILCINYKEAKKTGIIQEELLYTPWVTYDDIALDTKKVITSNQFVIEKRKFVNRALDLVNALYAEVVFKKQSSKNYQLRENLEEYVIAKGSIPPERLTEKNMENFLSKKLYKAYQISKLFIQMEELYTEAVNSSDAEKIVALRNKVREYIMKIASVNSLGLTKELLNKHISAKIYKAIKYVD